MIVKIDPADVVSVPSDCNYEKLRTCRYEVVGEYQGELLKPLYSSVFTDDYDDESEYENDAMDSDYWDQFDDEDEDFEDEDEEYDNSYPG